MVTTKTALEVPADPQWRHVVTVTVLSAVKALQFQLERSRGHRGQASKEELSQMGDLTLLLERALDDLDGMAGVTAIIVEVEADDESALVTVAGVGDQIEPFPPEPFPHSFGSVASFVDPLAGSAFAWKQSAATRSFRVPVVLPGVR